LELVLDLAGILLLVVDGALVSFAEVEPAEALPLIMSLNSARLSCPSWFLSALSKSSFALALAPDEALPLAPDEALPLEPLLLDPVEGLAAEGVAGFAWTLLLFASSAA